MIKIPSRCNDNKFKSGFLGAAIGLLVLAATGLHAGDGFLVTIPADQLTALDESSWSAPEKIGDKVVRKVLKAKTGSFTIPAWWGQTPRPEEGSVYVLEIDYRDDLSSPAIVSSFGNCEHHNTSSELHRFGGEASGQWKTADIPVSWDYLYVGPGNPAGGNKQLFSIRATDENANLDIRGVRVRKASSADEERYNAETRAWIAKAQLRHDPSKIIQLTATAAVLPDEWQTKACVPFSRSYLDPILPSDQPQKDAIAKTIKIGLALNQTESVQLGVYANQNNLDGVTFSVSDLKNKKGNTLQVQCDRYTMEYALEPHGDGKFWFNAERLWPLYEASIKAGQSQSFWLSFATDPKTAKPGTYRGEITFSAVSGTNKITEKVPLDVVVRPIRLLTMDEAGLKAGGCVMGAVPFHDISYAVKNNLNMVDLWAFSFSPVLKKENEKLVIDTTLMNEWMQGARQRGWGSAYYFMGEDPFRFPLTMSTERNLYGIMHQTSWEDKVPTWKEFCKLTSAHPNSVIDEVRPLLAQWIKEVSKAAKDNDWPLLILSPFDEPAKYSESGLNGAGEFQSVCLGAGPYLQPHFDDVCKMIRDNATPGTLIGADIHNKAGMVFLPYIDVFVTDAHKQDPSMQTKVLAAGKTYWEYGFPKEPFHQRFSWGFWYGAHGTTGMLLWAYNWGARFDISEGDNSIICWDTPFRTIPSPFYEAIREGLDDRRYIETLKRVAKAKGKEKQESAFLQNIYDQALSERYQGKSDTYDEWFSWAEEQPQDADTLDQWRDAIADKIVELSK